jgi:hypothetical protein
MIFPTSTPIDSIVLVTPLGQHLSFIVYVCATHSRRLDPSISTIDDPLLVDSISNIRVEVDIKDVKDLKSKFHVEL